MSSQPWPENPLSGRLPPRLVVLDADVLLNEMLHPLYAGRATDLIASIDKGSLRAFVTSEVLHEVLALPASFARHHGLERGEISAVWRDWYAGRVWVVGEVPLGNDPLIGAVARRDVRDAPTVALARLIAPATILSIDSDLKVMAIRDWRSATRDGRIMGVADETVVGFASTVGMALYGSGALVVGTVKAVSRLPPAAAMLLGIGIGLVAARTRGRWSEGWARALPHLVRFGEDLAKQTGDAMRVRVSIEARFDEREVPTPEPRLLLADAARCLALRPGLTAAEIADDLGRPASAAADIRALLRDNRCFAKVARGRWTLGTAQGPTAE
jgi:hypothetical protein